MTFFAVGLFDLVVQLCTTAACWLFLEAAGVVALCYLMTCLAINMRLYSYVLCCRFAALNRMDETAPRPETSAPSA